MDADVDKDFPTAIVPTQPGTIDARYDRMARAFGDPMARLFVLQATSLSEEIQVRAASELMSYRWPKRKASEVNVNAPQANAVIQINIGTPVTPATIDVTPTPTSVDPLS